MRVSFRLPVRYDGITRGFLTVFGLTAACLAICSATFRTWLWLLVPILRCLGVCDTSRTGGRTHFAVCSWLLLRLLCGFAGAGSHRSGVAPEGQHIRQSSSLELHAPPIARRCAVASRVPHVAYCLGISSSFVARGVGCA